MKDAKTKTSRKINLPKIIVNIACAVLVFFFGSSVKYGEVKYIVIFGIFSLIFVLFNIYAIFISRHRIKPEEELNKESILFALIIYVFAPIFILGIILLAIELLFKPEILKPSFFAFLFETVWFASASLEVCFLNIKNITYWGRYGKN